MSALLAHPLACAVLLMAAWWIADRVWTGTWSPERYLLRRRDIARFRRRLALNPGDRDARHRLATALLERGAHREALELLERNLADGEDDAQTLASAGQAAFASRDRERGTALLERARDAASRVALPGIDLALARGFADHGRWSDARAALLRFVDARPGSIEGYARLARAHEELGDAAAASDARHRGWICWREQPPFQRRFDRAWAWRLRPAFAAAHVGVAAAVAIVLGWGLSRIELPRMPAPQASAMFFADEELELEEQGWSVPRIGPAATPARFVRLHEVRDDDSRPTLVRARADLDNDLAIDMLHKLPVGDFVCRLPIDFGAPDDGNGIDEWAFSDSETGAEIHVVLDWVAVMYFVDATDAATAERSLFAFEQMIEDQPLRDCSLRVREPAGEVVGIRNGKPFGGQADWD